MCQAIITNAAAHEQGFSMGIAAVSRRVMPSRPLRRSQTHVSGDCLSPRQITCVCDEPVGVLCTVQPPDGVAMSGFDYLRARQIPCILYDARM